MNCPKCGVAIKESSKVCYNCGEDLEKYSIDQLIESMLNEDQEQPQSKENASKKINGKNKKKNKYPYSMGIRIAKGINIAIILIFIATLFLPWFVFGGEAFAKGYVAPRSGETVNLDAKVEFSAFELRQYGRDYESYYNMMTQSGEETRVWSSQLQLYYLQGVFAIVILGGISIILILLDRKMRTGEWIRAFSVISALVIGLIYATFKIPFFSMFARRTQNILRTEDILSAVKMNMDGIHVNDQFYAYTMTEQTGFYIAAIVCALWFVFSTILIELREDKED